MSDENLLDMSDDELRAEIDQRLIEGLDRDLAAEDALTADEFIATVREDYARSLGAIEPIPEARRRQIVQDAARDLAAEDKEAKP